MSECIQANSKNWVLYRYRSVLYSYRIQPSTDTHTVLYMYWVVMDCTVFVSNLYCILDDDTKTVLLSTVFLQLVSSSTIFVSAFYCIPKTCTSTVLSSTVFIPAIRYPVSVYGTGWYRNDVQNGTVCYLSNTGNTVSEQYQFLPYNSTGTVPSSTVMFTGDSPFEPFVLPAPGQPEFARLICGTHLGPPVLTRKQKRPWVNSPVCDRAAAFCTAGPPEVLSRMSRLVTQAAEREWELASAHSQRLI